MAIRSNPVDGKYIDRFQKIPLKVILHSSKTFQVDRNGQDVNINIPKDFAGKLIKNRAMGFISLRMPFVRVDSVVDTSAAYRAGLRKGDKIVSVNGQSTEYFHDFRNAMLKNKEKPLNMRVKRGMDTIDIQLVVPKKGAIGIENIEADSVFEFKTIHYSFFEAMPAGLAKSRETLE